MGIFKLFSKNNALVENMFNDEEKEFHPFVEKHIPSILDVDKNELIILHEFDNIDFVCVDMDGTIYLLECKLEKNPEVKRKVISQLIDYALNSYQFDFKKLSKAFGKDLVAYFIERKIEGFDSVLFKRNLEDNISEHAINIYIISDSLPDDLINSAVNIFVGEKKLRIKLAEIKRLKLQDEEIVFIRTINDEGKETSSPKGIFDETQFLNYIENKDLRDLFDNIIKRFKEKYPNGYFSFMRSGNAIFKIELPDKSYTIFILTKNGLYGQSGFAYLKLDKGYLLDYYRRFKSELKLKSLKPEDMIKDSACYKIFTENPLSFKKERLFDFIDEIILKIK